MDCLIIFEQESGCDYTIGCGIKIAKLECVDLNDAENDIVKDIYDNYPDIYNEDEREISRVTIYEIKGEKEVNLELHRKNKRKEEIEKMKKDDEFEDRKQFEKLKNKYNW